MDIYSVHKNYVVYGIIAGCFGKDFKTVKSRISKYFLQIAEVLKDDPWKAILESKRGTHISENKLRELHNDYKADPDKKGVPYYFIAKDIDSKEEFALFNNKYELVPINTKEEKEKATRLGISLGMDKDQLDFN